MSQQKRAVAALSSGGLDSAVMLVELSRDWQQVYPVYVRCGLWWEEQELASLRHFLTAVDGRSILEVQEICLPMHDVYGANWYVTGTGIPTYDEADEQWEIAGRNLVLLCKTAVWCRMRQVEAIALGLLKGNPFPDATAAFFSSLENVLRLGLGGRPLSVLRPLSGLQKSDVVYLGKGLPLELTLSCADPVDGTHCGLCGKCRERIEAFAAAGVSDPTYYRQSHGCHRV
jgi:7-cyano-7-deazaguanine synthase